MRANNGIDEDCDGQDLITATDDLTENNIKVYPIPTSGILMIENTGSNDINVVLLNFLGKEMPVKIGESTMDLSQIANGFYVLKIQDKKTNTIVIKRIILNK